MILLHRLYNKKMKKQIYLFLSIFIFVASFFFASRYFVKTALTNDSYLHLGIGKYISETKRLPTHEDISFKSTQPAVEIIPHSWLSDIFFYKIYQSDPKTLTILLIITLLVSVFISFKIMSLMELNLSSRLLILSLILLIIPVFYRIHPFIFSIILLLSISYIHVCWINGKNNLLFFLPIIFLLFANFSGGFIFIPGFFLLIILLLELFNKKHSLPKLIFNTVISLFITVINPLSYRIWIYLLTFILVFSSQSKSQSQLAVTLKLINQNYLKQNFSSTLYVIFVIYLLFNIFTFIWLTIKDGKKFLREVYQYLPYLLFFALSLIWVRLIPLTAFMTAPFFARLMFYLNKNRSLDKFREYQIITLLLYLIFVMYLLIKPPKIPIYDPPEDQVKLIKKHHLSDNIMTSYDNTGYVFFKNTPDRKAFLDSQDDLFDENETINYYAYLSPLPTDYLPGLVSKNNINTILVAKDTEELIEPLTANNDDWVLLYLDYNGLLFEKRDQLSDTFIKELAFKYLDLSRNLGFDPKEATSAANELIKFNHVYPDSILIAGQLASIYRISGQLDKAEKTLLIIPKEKWEYIIKIEMGRIKAAQGLCFSSEQYYLDALKERPEQIYSRTVLDLAVLYAGCFDDKVKAKHYFQRYSTFPTDNQEKELLKQLMEKFSIKIENDN